MLIKIKKNSAKIPAENLSEGIFQVDIPKLGKPIRGKVRDNWVINHKGIKKRIIITTDRQSAFVKTVCTIPKKGQISNLISAYWFEQTKKICPNHMIKAIHPNVLIAHQAKIKIPIEVILRRYIAKSTSPTSIYYNYFNRGRRKIYGINFPKDLKPNQELPMGTIITPTTKATNGYDKELTDKKACKIVDNQLGKGTWDKIKSSAYKVFEKARIECLSKGLILADTKFEFGINERGNLMLIDEILTPECSRYWLLNKEKFNKKNLELDKDIIINWLRKKGFNGKGKIPKIDKLIIKKMAKAYEIPYKMITRRKSPIQISNPNKINRAIMNYISKK